MSYRKVPENRILSFAATPAFKGWRQHFTKDSGSHPAKMNLNLIRWILKQYTETGDTVLDPMAGTGSTVVLASLLGRNGLAVECEPQFCKMIEENINRSTVQTSLRKKGSATCLHGDARELSKLLEESDVIITSPPYSDSNVGGDPDAKRLERLQAAIDRGDKISDRNKAWLKARLAGQQEGTQFDRQRGYHGGEKNVANLPHGDIASIITSPPYGNRLADDAVDDDDPDRMSYRQAIDVVLTSPPYEGTCLDARDPEARKKRLEEAGYDPKDYMGGKARNTVLENYDRNPIAEDIDSIITSPPYEDMKAFHDVGFMKDIVHEQNAKMKKGEVKGHSRSDEAELRYLNKINGVKYEQPENVGTLKGGTYLEAMLQIYRECHKVLSPGGVMILVIKNFIRDFKVIRLDEETIKLCEEVGFSLIDHWYFKLPSMSFWRRLYLKKYPSAPNIIFEDVLVFKKRDER